MRSYLHSEVSLDAGLHEAVGQAREGRSDLLTRVMRAHNQRMYRIARSILRNDAEAEDIVQDAFVKAFSELETLRDAGNIGAWLAQVTANLSLSRLRQMKHRSQAISSDIRLEDFRMERLFRGSEAAPPTPERHAALNDVRGLLEREIDRLADGFREVFMLRVVEQMSVEETADTLGLKPETVKTRLHRAKAALRAGLRDQFAAMTTAAFPFGGVRCQRTTAAVLARMLGQLPIQEPNSHR